MIFGGLTLSRGFVIIVVIIIIIISRSSVILRWWSFPLPGELELVDVVPKLAVAPPPLALFAALTADVRTSHGELVHLTPQLPVQAHVSGNLAARTRDYLLLLQAHHKIHCRILVMPPHRGSLPVLPSYAGSQHKNKRHGKPLLVKSRPNRYHWRRSRQKSRKKGRRELTAALSLIFALSENCHKLFFVSEKNAKYKIKSPHYFKNLCANCTRNLFCRIFVKRPSKNCNFLFRLLFNLRRCWLVCQFHFYSTYPKIIQISRTCLLTALADRPVRCTHDGQAHIRVGTRHVCMFLI